MVVTRSQTKLSAQLHTGDAGPHTTNANKFSNFITNAPQTPPREEPLGRGCRIPRPAAPTYDSLYVSEALTRRSKQPAVQELQINTRYPERDAAKRAVTKLSDTLELLDGSGAGPSESSDDSDGNDRCAMHTDGTPTRKVPHGRFRCNGTPGKVVTRKRDRDESVDSSITDESLRRGSPEEEAGGLLFEHSSLDLSSEEPLSDCEVQRAKKNAKVCVSKNKPINHYLSAEIKETSLEDKKGLFGASRGSRQRRTEDVLLGLSGADDAAHRREPGLSKEGNNNALGDITPLNLDTSVTFEKVGGLSGHIVLLREMVLLPLMYPGMLQAMSLSPPRGVLFVGPPGTGKTLMARALANEGMLHANQKITFFMRKGADILSKWVGEAERQLILLFEEAKRQQPSIIFFDELDGLVPVRHAKAEQSQAALVATLLALIDGLDDRGRVVVIGATNRPDTIDPALRRPGRFDRELYFPLPDGAARRHILDIVTKPMLPADRLDREEILQELTDRCAGWTGAEIQAVCTEAGLNRLRTALPQIYTTSKKLQIPEGALIVQREDFFIAAHRVKTSARRVTTAVGDGLDEHLEYLLNSTRCKLLSFVAARWPSASTALAKEKRDCSNSADAVRELSSFPISNVAHPFLLFLTTEAVGCATDREDSEFAVQKAAIALTKGLPSIRTFTLYLPHLVVDRDASGLLGVRTTGDLGPLSGNLTCGEGGDDLRDSNRFDTGHIYSCIAAVRRCSGPSLVILKGLEEWLADHAPEVDASFGCGNKCGIGRSNDVDNLCYYLNCLRDTDALIIAPTVRRDVPSTFFAGNRLSIQLRTAVCEVPCTPSDDDLRRFLSYLLRVVDLALKTSAPINLQELPEDLSPPPPLSPKQVRAAWLDEVDLWRRVDFRRRQLRHVLTKWVGQYINNKKFSVFVSRNLDLTPTHDLYNHWQQHTNGRQISLSDVMMKLENEEYTSLSQYNNDIDMLVNNVRSFFRTVSAFDLRYRVRASELKELTVLNLYKINRAVVSFCEKHKDLVMPGAPPPCSTADKALQEPPKTPQRGTTGATPTQRKKPRYYGMRRRRRPANRGSRSCQKKAPVENVERDQPREAEIDVLGSSGSRDDNHDREEKDRRKTENMEVEVKTMVEEEMVEVDGAPVDESIPRRLEVELPQQCDIAGLAPEDGEGTEHAAEHHSPDGTYGSADEWMGVMLLKLRGFSFLRLHLVMQAAMRLLESEVQMRRVRGEHQQTTEFEPASSSREVSPFKSSMTFCSWMLLKAVQEVEVVSSNG